MLRPGKNEEFLRIVQKGCERLTPMEGGVLPATTTLRCQGRSGKAWVALIQGNFGEPPT